jgi:murein endopeptidase
MKLKWKSRCPSNSTEYREIRTQGHREYLSLDMCSLLSVLSSEAHEQECETLSKGPLTAFMPCAVK